MVGEPKPEHPLHPHRPPFNRRQLLMQAVVAGVILASGIGIGTGGTILALRDRIVPSIRVLPPNLPPGPGPEPNDLVNRWRNEYGLSDKQRQQTLDTLIKQFAATRELRQKFFAAEQGEREKFAAAIKKIFNPEQFTKWQQALEERAKHWQRMRPFDGRGGGRGGPPRGERGPGRPKDPNDRRWEGPPRPPMEFGGRRGDWPPRGPMDPNGRHRGDRPPDRPPEPEIRPADANAPK
jgi:hypothetical protein